MNLIWNWIVFGWNSMIEWVMNWDGKGLLLGGYMGCSSGGWARRCDAFHTSHAYIPVNLRFKRKFLLGRWAAAVLVAELELSWYLGFRFQTVRLRPARETGQQKSALKTHIQFWYTPKVVLLQICIWIGGLCLIFLHHFSFYPQKESAHS